VPSDVKRLGLLGMTERAQFVGGELHIASGGGGGTLVTARFPMAAEPAARVHAHAS
jgi:signal transduction histidine kinase